MKMQQKKNDYNKNTIYLIIVKTLHHSQKYIVLHDAAVVLLPNSKKALGLNVPTASYVEFACSTSA